MIPQFAFVAVAVIAAEETGLSVSIEEIESVLEETERVLRGYQVRCEIDARLRKYPFDRNEFRFRSTTVTYSADMSGRVRAVGRAQTSDGATTEVTSNTVVYNGGQSSRLTEQSGSANGRITPHEHEAYLDGVNPRNFVTHVRNRSAVLLLREYQAQVVGTTEFDGRSAVTVETAVVSNVGMQWMTRLLFAPDLDLALVRAADCFRHNEGQEWKEFVRTELFEHVQDPSGIWLPSRVVHEEYSAPKETEPESVLLQHMEVITEDWQVNPELPEELFSLDFPSGTLVEDRVNGTTFKTTEISDQTIFDQVAAVKPLKNTSNSSTRTWLIWLNVAVLLGIGILILLRRRQMHKS
jgi:hypothetical protein